jgi:hypothetical protein
VCPGLKMGDRNSKGHYCILTAYTVAHCMLATHPPAYLTDKAADDYEAGYSHVSTKQFTISTAPPRSTAAGRCSRPEARILHLHISGFPLLHTFLSRPGINIHSLGYTLINGIIAYHYLPSTGKAVHEAEAANSTLKYRIYMPPERPWRQTSLTAHHSPAFLL